MTRIRIIEECSLDNAPRMNLRFNEFSLLTAYNLLTRDCIEKHKVQPGRFNVFIPAMLLNEAKTILYYPASKNMLRLVERNLIDEICVCCNIDINGASAMWAVQELSSEDIIISSGTVPAPSILEPEITYIR